MATGPASPPHYQPKPRWLHCSALVQDKWINYGGHFGADGYADPPTSVDIFNTTTDTWEAVVTSGTPPPGVFGAACVAVGHLLYHIGGNDSKQHYNSIHCLDTRTNMWTEIHPNNPDAAPMVKWGMAIVSCQQTLVTVGGYGSLPTNRHPDVEYVVDPDSEGEGWTNEVVCYDIEHNTWVRPHITSTPPPACTQCSLTRVNGSCAVMYAGIGKDRELVPPDVYILDMLHWTWTKIPASQTPGHPVGRFGHSAVSLHDPDGYPANPALLVMWGASDGGELLRDSWIFHLNQRQWRKVILPDILKGRFYHTSLVHHFLPKIKIISFGGLDSWPEDDDPDKIVPIAQTTIVSMSCSGGNPPEWRFTDTHVVGQEELPTHMQVTIEEEMRHLAVCEKVMRDKGKVDLNVAGCLLNGPPRVGKSTFLCRITGRPLPQSDGSSETPSTGVSDRILQVVIKKSSLTVAMAPEPGMNWQVITLSQEAATMLKAILSSKPSSVLQHHESHMPSRQSSSILTPKPVEGSTMVLHSQPPATAEESSLVAQSHQRIFKFSRHNKLCHRIPGYQVPLEIFQSVLKSKEWASAEDLFKQALNLYFSDVGGQPEFQEVLPAIIAGPSVFFSMFKLPDDLDQKYRVQYVDSLSHKSIAYESSFTVLESILQFLASIACMCRYVRRRSSKLVPIKPKIFLVGTHKDQADKKHVQKIQRQLKDVLVDTEFYKEGMIIFASLNEPAFTINNLSDDGNDVSNIRQRVEDVLRKDPSFRIPVPAPWLALMLSIRLVESSVISFDSCRAIAKECGINDDDELADALWFLHTKLGVIRYFSEISELSDIVICDPQIIFDKITCLITRTFKYKDIPNVRTIEEFQQKGKFPAQIIEEISRGSNELLTVSKLVILLKHLHVIAEVYEDEEHQKTTTHYFMPCVLSHAPLSTENLSTVKDASVNIPPICILFQCGYCPKGVFGALISDLLNHGSQWRLDSMFRDQVTFRFGLLHHIVTLSFHAKFLEVNISAKTERAKSQLQTNAKQVCSGVRLEIKKHLNNVSKSLLYGPGAHFFFGFYSSSCSCSMPALCYEKNPLIMTCSICNSMDDLEAERCWFDEPLEHSDTLGVRDLNRILNAVWDARAKWYYIGLGLEIDPGTLDAIERSNHDDGDRFTKVLNAWLKHHQPKPTIALLAETLKSPTVGHGQLAEHLTSQE